MSDDDKHCRPRSIFRWDPFETHEQIDSYLRAARATGDEDVVNDAEYLARLFREQLTQI